MLLAPTTPGQACSMRRAVAQTSARRAAGERLSRGALRRAARACAWAPRRPGGYLFAALEHDDRGDAADAQRGGGVGALVDVELATLRRPLNSPAIWSMKGAICLQGPHHVAVKSMSTGSVQLTTSAWKFWSVTVFTRAQTPWQPPVLVREKGSRKMRPRGEAVNDRARRAQAAASRASAARGNRARRGWRRPRRCCLSPRALRCRRPLRA